MFVLELICSAFFIFSQFLNISIQLFNFKSVHLFNRHL
nr:MAG TPA: hypothetical protein [Caudoviricetes sp.]